MAIVLVKIAKVTLISVCLNSDDYFHVFWAMHNIRWIVCVYGKDVAVIAPLCYDNAENFHKWKMLKHVYDA